MILIASDHIGVNLKRYLIRELSALGHKLIDLGPISEERVDYTDFAKILTERLVEKPNTKGILICGTGIGMSIMANKKSKVRAAVCTNEYMAEMSRRHNDSNVLCLGARVVGSELALSVVEKFLNTKFEGGRHLRRVKELNK